MDYFEIDCPCQGKYLDWMLQPCILTALYREELHGFALIQKIAESPMFGGNLPDKTGVYRYLKKMESAELLTSEWDFDADGSNPKRIYAITEKGKNYLINWYKVLTEYSYSIRRLLKNMEKNIMPRA